MTATKNKIIIIIKKKKNGWDIMPENETARNDSRSHLDNVS